MGKDSFNKLHVLIPFFAQILGGIGIERRMELKIEILYFDGLQKQSKDLLINVKFDDKIQCEHGRQ